MSAQLLLHLEWIRVQDMADARRCVSKDQKESWVMEGTVRSIAERTVGGCHVHYDAGQKCCK